MAITDIERKRREKKIESLNSILKGEWTADWKGYQCKLDPRNVLLVEEDGEGSWCAWIQGTSDNAKSEGSVIDQYVTEGTAEECLTKLISRINEIHTLLQREK